MSVSLIVALAENHCIGINNQLPWQQSNDLQHFKKLTLSKPVIMGRKTYESIGKPLPNRPNIIISRDKNYQAAGCEVYHSLPDALKAYATEPEVMIIGGAQIFFEALPLVDKIYLTWIHTHIDGDAFFPYLNQEEWIETNREFHNADAKNQFDYSFVMLEREDR
jgi:dihydrofolate reductase